MHILATIWKMLKYYARRSCDIFVEFGESVISRSIIKWRRPLYDELRFVLIDIYKKKNKERV